MCSSSPASEEAKIKRAENWSKYLQSSFGAKKRGGKNSRSVRPRKIIKIKHKNKHGKSHQHKRIFPCNTAFKYANFFVVSGIGGVSGIANGTSRYNVFFTSAGSHFTIMFQHCLVEVQLVHTIPSC